MNPNSKIDRHYAKCVGANKYWSETPCKHGHLGWRYTRRKSCVTCDKDSSAKWKAKNPERFDYNQKTYLKYPTPTRPMSEFCEGGCGRRSTSKALALDHCHKTGKFRGWLCMRCNTGLGKLGDNAEGLIRMLLYVKRADKTT